MAGIISVKQPSNDTSIYLPIMPRTGEEHEGRLETDHFVGRISESESG